LANNADIVREPRCYQLIPSAAKQSEGLPPDGACQAHWPICWSALLSIDDEQLAPYYVILGVGPKGD
jgi:hypothetical protein